MPWSPEDASRHTHKANTPHRQKIWASAANSVLAATGDEGRAVRAGNAAVNKYNAGGADRSRHGSNAAVHRWAHQPKRR